MSNAIDHERIKQITAASILEMPQDINPVIGLFEQRKKIAEHIIKNIDELQLIELNNLFDAANYKIKEYLAL